MEIVRGALHFNPNEAGLMPGDTQACVLLEQPLPVLMKPAAGLESIKGIYNLLIIGSRMVNIFMRLPNSNISAVHRAFSSNLRTVYWIGRARKQEDIAFSLMISLCMIVR